MAEGMASTDPRDHVFVVVTPENRFVGVFATEGAAAEVAQQRGHLLDEELPDAPESEADWRRNPAGERAALLNSIDGLLCAYARQHRDGDDHEAAAYALSWFEQATGRRHDYHNVIYGRQAYEEV